MEFAIPLAPDRAARLLIAAARKAGTLVTLEFDEAQHPRDSHGEFTSGGDSGSGDLGSGVSADHETLRLYTQSGGTYREVNEGLRGEKDMSQHATVVALDKAFKEQGEPAPAVVYRGIAGYQAGEGDPDPDTGEMDGLGLAIGQTFTDKGFVSTSDSKDAAVKFATHGVGKLEGEEAMGVIFKINTKGADSLNMSRFSRYGESEHLLNRSTTFKVKSIKEGRPGKTLAIVTMDVVK